MNISKSLITASVVLLLFSFNSPAQSIPVVSDLLAPTKIISTPGGSFLVAEAGTGSNDGRISIIDENGTRRTLVDGLPSAAAPPEGAASGPSGLALRGNTLFVTIGEGDVTMNSSVPGFLVANPNPSSPLFSSVLAIRLGGDVEDITDGVSLTPDDHDTLETRARLRLTNDDDQRITIELIVDIRDFTFEFRQGGPVNNVRASNPFGIAVRGNLLYVVNAGQNAILEVDPQAKTSRVFLRFPGKANPLPFGPRVIDVVPNSIRTFGRQLLVTFLIGFPFPAGESEVVRINPVNKNTFTLIDGLSSAIDVLPVEDDLGNTQFYVLEFSTDMLGGAPGRLLRFDSPDATPVVIASNLTSPTSLARDDETGDILITEIFPGRVVRVPTVVGAQ